MFLLVPGSLSTESASPATFASALVSSLASPFAVLTLISPSAALRYESSCLTFMLKLTYQAYCWVEISAIHALQNTKETYQNK